jgi:hypothetical protein
MKERNMCAYIIMSQTTVQQFVNVPSYLVGIVTIPILIAFRLFITELFTFMYLERCVNDLSPLRCAAGVSSDFIIFVIILALASYIIILHLISRKPTPPRVVEPVVIPVRKSISSRRISKREIDHWEGCSRSASYDYESDSD